MATTRDYLRSGYKGSRRRRAALALGLRDLADDLAAGRPGLGRWRWRASLIARRVYRSL